LLFRQGHELLLPFTRGRQLCLTRYWAFHEIPFFLE
jgi:hypothetical protein